jgi:hypothetical protein
MLFKDVRLGQRFKGKNMAVWAYKTPKFKGEGGLFCNYVTDAGHSAYCDDGIEVSGLGQIFATCGHELENMEDGVHQERSDGNGTYWGFYCKQCAKDNGTDCHIVETGPSTWEEAAQTIANEVVKVLTTRQHDYGQGNILGFGEKGIVVRIWDKVNRLKNLLWDTEDEPKGERVEDTFTDLAGYSIIALLLRKGWFTLPLLSIAKEENHDKLS